MDKRSFCQSIIVSQISLAPGTSEREAAAAALRRLGLQPAMAEAAVCRRSVDARKPGRVRMVYSVRVTPRGDCADILARLVDQKNIRLLREAPPPPIARGSELLAHRPVVVGFGPAGIFAALLLARSGMRPLVLERGPEVEGRAAAVELFWRTGQLDAEANVQFGEGGAGTFSDGKLVTRIGDHRCSFVLETFAAHGAPRDIITDAKPHVGTDLLRGIVRSIRSEITRLGGEILFNTRLEALYGDGRLRGIASSGGVLPCEALILAVGHSARDTAASLIAAGLELEKKPFSVGFRIEHSQRAADKMFYGASAGHPALPPAEYQLSHRVGERACYTFCMCPGGVVAAAASEAGGLVTNGMSYSGRAGRAANSALVASVLPGDIEGGVEAAIEYQRAIERAAFGEGFSAPYGSAARLAGIRAADTSTPPTYPRGVMECGLEGLLPPPAEALIKDGLRRFEHMRPGFAGGMLTGVETRTSSPWRILREGMQATRMEGLFPAGEGAGYAGGIVSAAVDGLRAAEALLERWGGIESCK